MDIPSIDNQTQQPVSDDQELAKALAGVTQGDDIQYEETNATPGAPLGDGFGQAPGPAAPVTSPTPVEPVASFTPAPSTDGDAPSDPALADVKQAALSELRPLIDKLDVDPEEKFNTYLLLIRSTDDKDLIAPAHEAAKSIADEAKKAQALLDIIKEIDFLSNPQQTA